MGVLYMVDIVGEIAGVDCCWDMEILGDLIKDSCRLADVGAPFKDQGGLKPADCRCHQHQFLERERMDTDQGYKGMGDER